ncbi:Abi family protein [Aliidiomarina maris]|uniref:Abortive infection bacteriophage resistance protein n=1 Tax=Aliidiomarina maris TaxID=531312 RepID=A0A327X341_9GAMM|nr:Abi family protein [Aliidiomarina maris]RAJ97092.1 abortive infection bacteriophage resistance protein [Aliidiomarina maris]RUO24692.1 hypothetical protein CWE07_08480 [Aliidiomarina maris]
MPESRVFSKQPLDYEALVAKLELRGLIINDHNAALMQLQRISYYRFVGYGLPFECYSSDGVRLGAYLAGTRFEHILKLYNDDVLLRHHILEALGEIEIGVRNLVNHTMCLQHQNAHWFMDSANFVESDKFKHQKLLKKIAVDTSKAALDGSEKQQQRELFIQHYYSRYDEPPYPPGWMIAEVLSLGSWSTIYAHFAVSRDKKAISKRLDLSPATLTSWLHALTYLRNLCAHHGRLARRHLTIQPKQDKALPIREKPCLFNYLCVIWYLLERIFPESEWLDRLFDIVERVDQKFEVYGIPNDWFEDEFWLAVK